MWINIPDTPLLAGNSMPSRSEHGMEDPRVAIRYYKAILAEEERKRKKEEDNKKKKESEAKKTFWQKCTPGRVSMFLFFTWPLVAIAIVYEFKLLLAVLETTFTK